MNGRVAMILAGMLMFAGVSTAAQPDYAVKARFLVNFALYTYWPAQAFASDRAPVNICLYGRDPFGRMLDEAAGARQYTSGGSRPRSLNVWRTGSVAELTDCHVVFVSGIDVDEKLVRRIGAPYRLLVGESAQLIRHGGHINVYKGDDGMKFEVNLDAVKRTRLSLSSQLLRLARIVSNVAEAGR